MRGCLLTGGLLLIVGGCSGNPQPAKTLTLATTTSTRDSGLLKVLLPEFERQTGYRVKVVAVGSGQALELGRRGDADVLLTHAPAAEKRFLADGYAAQRLAVMSNDFVIVGPASDPARLAEAVSARDAFLRIARTQTRFISRGDRSGTHLKEEQLWQAAGIVPSGTWYLKAGAGMAQTLRIASEKRACTLSDRSTFLAQRSRLELTILYEGDPRLRNHYAVLLVNPQRHPHVNTAGGKAFIRFLLSPETQRLIGNYGREQYGQPLFFPHRPAGNTKGTIRPAPKGK